LAALAHRLQLLLQLFNEPLDPFDCQSVERLPGIVPVMVDFLLKVLALIAHGLTAKWQKEAAHSPSSVTAERRAMMNPTIPDVSGSAR
jgi:hypothetical protein